MATLNTYSDQARLSLAAYASLNPVMTQPQYVAALQDGGNGMSVTQAEQFSAEFLIIDQFNDPFSGLSATLFRRSGQAFLAIRGTELSDIYDLIADLSIAIGLGADRQFNSLRGFIDSLYTSGRLAVGEIEHTRGQSHQYFHERMNVHQ